MAEPIDNRLAAIANASIQADWSQISPERAVVDLSLPTFNPDWPYDKCVFGGVFINGNEGQFVHTGMLAVTNPELRGHGLGERLVRSLGSLSSKYGFTQFKAEIFSEYALDIEKRVYGEERLSYLSVNHGLLRTRPRTYDQARRRLARWGKHDPGRGSPLRVHGIKVGIDLEGLDMSEWELPIESTSTPNFSH